jgi:hypothetical protein
VIASLLWQSFWQFSSVKLALEKGFNRVIIESDSKEDIHYIQHGIAISFPFIALLSDVFRLLRVMESVKISYFIREGNKVVDALAKWV